MVQVSAAARKIDITPDDSDLERIFLQGYGDVRWMKTKGRLFARVLVLDTAGTRAVIVGVDSCFSNETAFSAKRHDSPRDSPDLKTFSRTFAPGTRRLWAEAAGCPADHVIVSATHTHTAPQTFGGNAHDNKVEAVSRAIRDAAANLEGATMSISARRDEFPPPAGGIPMTPGIARLRRPTLEPAGTDKNPNPPAYLIDDTLSVLRIGRQSDDTKPPIALLVNYGIHPTLWADIDNMSPDLTGEAMTMVEDLLDPGRRSSVSIFIQGCCGDVSPVWPDGNRDYDAVKAIGLYLARNVDLICRNGTPLSPVVVRGATSTFKPRRRHNYGADATPRPEPEVVVSGIRLANDAVLLGVSGELFSAYRRKLADWAQEANSRWAHVLVGGFVNGYSGYLPTAEDFRHPSPGFPNPRYVLEKLGGETYEMSTTPYTEAIETELKGGINSVLAELG